jgi:hypothetical protein
LNFYDAQEAAGQEQEFLGADLEDDYQEDEGAINEQAYCRTKHPFNSSELFNAFNNESSSSRGFKDNKSF